MDADKVKVKLYRRPRGGWFGHGGLFWHGASGSGGAALRVGEFTKRTSPSRAVLILQNEVFLCRTPWSYRTAWNLQNELSCALLLTLQNELSRRTFSKLPVQTPAQTWLAAE